MFLSVPSHVSLLGLWWRHVFSKLMTVKATLMGQVAENLLLGEVAVVGGIGLICTFCSGSAGGLSFSLCL